MQWNESMKTYPGADVPSDHNLFLSELQLKLKGTKRRPLDERALGFSRFMPMNWENKVILLINVNQRKFAMYIANNIVRNIIRKVFLSIVYSLHVLIDNNLRNKTSLWSHLFYFILFFHKDGTYGRSCLRGHVCNYQNTNPAFYYK